ncbi:MAG: polysaccharide deacetylase family protein [Chthoniobacterales bacterium]|nr:polysaccharide deacetylase family protein [Chthoniobacterales bacterium]
MQFLRPANSSDVIRALLLGFAAVAPLLAIALIHRNVWLALVPLFVSHLLMLWATLVPNCQWWGPVFTRFKTGEREVWLTLDDGPSPAHTLKILDLLKQFDAKATFFVIGANAEKYPHLVTEILTRGHTLANHTWSHPSGTFWCAGPARTHCQIDRCAKTLRTIPERPALYFRAPAGLKNMFVHPALARRGMALVGWTVRGLDTVKRDPVAVAERIEKAIAPGAIVLLHEGHHAESRPDFNPRCLELILQRLSARGYRFVLPLPEQLVCSRGL